MSIPALLRSLDWHDDESRDEAIAAAQWLADVEATDAEKAQIADALDRAYSRVTGTDGIDNRLRIELVRALGRLRHRRATPALVRITTTRAPEQSFLINRLAAQQLIEIEDPAAVGALVDALFLFEPENPSLRMNDVATEGLARIGRPSSGPLLALLRGENAAANAIAAAYIEAVRARDPQSAAAMSVEDVVATEATSVLGALGYAEHLAPLLEETRSPSLTRRLGAVIALTRLHLDASESGRVREAVETLFRDAPVDAQPQLVAVMQHTFDAGAPPFFLARIRDRRLHPAVRTEAARALALLANAAEVRSFRALLRREPSNERGGLREDLARREPMLDLADECDERLDCWIEKLANADASLLQKACAMIARYGRGNDAPIAPLTGLLGHDDILVRLAALEALDRIATRNVPAAVERIDALRRAEEDRPIWIAFRDQAMTVRARLIDRGR